MMKTKYKVIALLLIGVPLILSASYHKNETTEVIPAQLELVWEQNLPIDSSQNLRNIIPVEMVQQLRQIGEYSSTTQISYRENAAKVECKIVFLKEMKSTEISRITPLLRSIFKEKPFQMTFRGEQRKYVTRVGYGIFSRTTSASINSNTMTATIPERAKVNLE